MDTVLIRCENCNTINRVLIEKINMKPKCHHCQEHLKWTNKPVDIHSENFQKEIIENPGITLIEFWSPTCGYCHAMNPLLEQFASDKAGIVKLAKINSEAEGYTASHFNITGVPTFVLFKDGQKISQVAGAMNRIQLDIWVKQNAGV
jgi:thioredoxin 2